MGLNAEFISFKKGTKINYDDYNWSVEGNELTSFSGRRSIVFVYMFSSYGEVVPDTENYLFKISVDSLGKMLNEVGEVLRIIKELPFAEADDKYGRSKDDFSSEQFEIFDKFLETKTREFFQINFMDRNELENLECILKVLGEYFEYSEEMDLYFNYSE